MKELYLVTGATGHLGNTVAHRLARAGRQVRALVLPGEEHAPQLPGGVEAVVGDVRSPASLEALFAGAAKDGLTLYATSGYRSYSTQKAIFERKLDRMSEKQANLSVAKPGYSEHQTGLAMDIEGETTKGTGLTEAFGESPEGIWAAKHCAEYGFIIRYPKDKTKITGYIYEPWHLRYVGREAAQEITALDVTFEEYIAMVRSDRIQWLQEETQYDDQNP